MAPSSKKRKASELDTGPDLNGHATPKKGKRKSKKTQNVSDTAPAPEHGYTVVLGSDQDEDIRTTTTSLWNEVNFNCTYSVRPQSWEDIKTYRNFIRRFFFSLAAAPTGANTS